MLLALGSAVGVYAGIAGILVLRRFLKILELYDEYQFVRSREQKNHIKQHALALRFDLKSDALWFRVLAAKGKKAFVWLKTA
jgi:hypothetical protein